jgi:hypothetical protein
VLIYPGKSHLIQPVAGSPPAFMAAGYDDRPDISVGLAEAYLRFKKAASRPSFTYAKTGHGFGIRPERAGQSHQGVVRPPRVVPASHRIYQIGSQNRRS